MMLKVSLVAGLIAVTLCLAAGCASAESKFECELCGLVVNAVEGFLSENATETQVIDALQSQVCGRLPAGIKAACDDMSYDATIIIDKLDADEIRGASAALGLPEGALALANIAYVLSDACTSIVAQTDGGNIIHGRNLDFGEGLGFTAALRKMVLQVEVQQNGKTIYEMTTYAGFVGGLTGMRPGGWAATINTAFAPGKPIVGQIKDILKAIENGGGHFPTLLLRDALGDADNFDAAMATLSDTVLYAPVFYTVSGVSAGQGCVISRNVTGSQIPTRCLNADAGQWFVLETNYLWDKPAPWYDDRRATALAQMADVGRSRVTLHALFEDVLSVRPVFNQLTTYTILASAHNATLESYSRFCNFPCPV